MRYPDSFAIISDEVSQELSTIRKFVERFELPGIELRSLNGRAFKDLNSSDVSELAQIARGENWKIYGCATPVFKCSLHDESAIKEHEELFKKGLDVARQLDCGLARVFAFLRESPTLNNTSLEKIVGHLHSLLDIARGSGVRIGLENEHSCMIGDATELAAALARLPDDGIGVVWDPCNTLYLPEPHAPNAMEIDSFAHRIIHVHVKDAALRRNGASETIAMPIGTGEVGWRSQFETLERFGYAGAYSLETHWRLKAINEDLLHLPAGYAFSQGGEEATRTCLRNLKAILDLSQ